VNCPVDLRTFNYREKDSFATAYEWAGSCGKLATAMREAGRQIDENTLVKWRARLDVPIVQEAYRARNDRPPISAPTELPSKVRELLKRTKRQWTIEGLCDHFAVCPRDVRAAVAALEEQAVLVKVTDAGIILSDELFPTREPEVIDWHKYAEVEIPVGVTADNHIGSKYERMDVIEAAFDYWESQGVRTVYQAGNIIDGEKRGINENDIYVHGFEDQTANLIQKWPSRPGMRTDFITGMCHEGWYIKQNKINVGRRIEQEARDRGRDDLHFLGHLEHDLHFKQEGGEARVRLFHAGGGSAYATSYKPQKIVESYQGGEKPNALIIGHFHKADTGYPREVYTVQPGCTEDQTPWMRQHNIAAHVGFTTLWIRQNTLGIITSWKVEWRPFYDRKFYQFNW
jgi:predicted phosphodiesterase